MTHHQKEVVRNFISNWCVYSQLVKRNQLKYTDNVNALKLTIFLLRTGHLYVVGHTGVCNERTLKRYFCNSMTRVTMLQNLNTATAHCISKRQAVAGECYLKYVYISAQMITCTEYEFQIQNSNTKFHRINKCNIQLDKSIPWKSIATQTGIVQFECMVKVSFWQTLPAFQNLPSHLKFYFSLLLPISKST